MTATGQRTPRNGVDVPTPFATLDAVKGAPDIARFQGPDTDVQIDVTTP